jgi:hypothetical protein
MMVTPFHDPEWQQRSSEHHDTSSAGAHTTSSAGAHTTSSAGAHTTSSAGAHHHGTSGASASQEQDDEILSAYPSSKFKDYLQRGWCRIEVFFNANIPVNPLRSRLFGGELGEVMVREGRRPHLVYGTREKDENSMPVILPALQDHLFTKYHPGRGDLHDPRDAVVLDAFVEELYRINENLQVSTMCIYVYI